MGLADDNIPGASSRWMILFLSYLCMLAFAVTLQMVPPIIPRLVSDTGMTHAQAGALMGLFTFPGIFIALPGGRISDIVGPRAMGLLSLILITLGTLLMLPLASTFLYAGRFLSGIGAGILVVIAPQIVTQHFYRHEIGVAMGIFNTAVPLGSIAAFNGLGYLTGRFGIQVVIVSTAGVSLLALAAFASLYPADPRHAEGGTVHPALRPAGLGPGIWLVAIAWTLFNVGVLAYFTYSIDHLAGIGMPPTRARFLGSFPMLISIFLTPFSGLAIQRYRLRWSLTTAGCLLSSAAIYLLIQVPSLTFLWSLLLGWGISMVPPSVFTIAGEVVPSSRTGTGFGILTTFFNMGMFAGIPLVGLIRDVTTGYQASFAFMAAVLLTGAFLGVASSRLLSG